jgi:AraC family transcriptional activator of pobA
MIAAMDHTDLGEIVTIVPLEEIACLQSISASTWADKERLSILFIAKGGGRCRQGGEGIVLQERTVYTGMADCFQEFEIDKGTIGYLVSINPHKLEMVLENVTVAYKGLFAIRRPCLRLDAELTEEMDWLMTRIFRKGRSKEKYSIEIVHKYVSLLLLHLQSEIEDELVLVSMNRKGILIKGFFTLLEEAFMTARAVDYYAEKLFVSPKHLTNVIKLESGYPTSYHISQRIVLEAKRMVQASGASLKQIAYELGYEDVAAFSKLFKRVTGENFSAYKCNLKYAFGKLR